ncbi:sigma factor-like helix-turn-helix DNA-binding protein [Mediterraneibacter sp.]
MILYYFIGLTYERIAEMEHCSRQAVMKSVSAAVQKLKKLLQ